MHSCRSNGTGPLSWRECFASLKKNYLDYYAGDTVDVYFVTYDSPDLQYVIEAYSPVKYISFQDHEFDHHTQGGNICTLLSLVEDPTSYDQVLLTRFDLLYKLPVPQWGIDPTKINVPFMQPSGAEVWYNDCFYVFPGGLFEAFQSTCQSSVHSPHLHQAAFDRVKLMTEERYFSDTDYPEFFPLNQNPFYVLHRRRTWGFSNREEAWEEAKRQGFV